MTYAHAHTYSAHPSRVRALPIPPRFFLGDDDEAERTAAMLRADYLPAVPPKHAKEPAPAPGYLRVQTSSQQSWYGEWNRGDIQDVISSLRELR